MLGEGFLRALPYTEERRFASRRNKAQARRCSTDALNCAETELRTEAGPNEEAIDSSQPQALKEMPQALSIPGCSPLQHPDLTLCIDNCSLLEQYPDLQVADTGRISHNPLRAPTAQQGSHSPCAGQHPEWTVHHRPQDDPVSSVPDQGYLVMGPSEDVSLDLPGLEPMSNSVLNGMLDKQLEEFWMQHLTDNLARCNSHLGNSILHGLVQPPQPCSHRQGPDSLEPSLGEGSEDSDRKISYLHTHNLGPCSSNFSSPVLRISESENPHVQ
ncbi:uncharacterized protein si:dkey-237j10.2 [Betta splendens]|uniref:Uncharacterized protein si:dkey-237j10.2 n=1 Tax=Betta splendens TaxID=158456 RepID=A0A9W2Y358_BETSP|nr:uncharacterized protein si:dkey-237j10.2 [Betta splendens]